MTETWAAILHNIAEQVSWLNWIDKKDELVPNWMPSVQNTDQLSWQGQIPSWGASRGQRSLIRGPHILLSDEVIVTIPIVYKQVCQRLHKPNVYFMFDFIQFLSAI